MEEVVIDIRQHSRAGPEVVKGALQALWIRAVLGGGDGRVCCSYLEYDRGLLIGYGGLRYELVGEGVPPREDDANLGKS